MLGACRGEQSVLDPRGPLAAGVADVAWVMFAGATVILALVMALAFLAIYRRSRTRAVSPDLVIGLGGVAFPVVVLSALLAWGVPAMGLLRAGPAPAIEIEVVGRQFHWEVRHPAGAVLPARVLIDELRLPAGVPVGIRLRAEDVIHSFWVPGLAGKLDAIPGRENRMVLMADAPGELRGQCAEYCGTGHAFMVLRVVVMTPAAFDAWRTGAPPGEGAHGDQ